MIEVFNACFLTGYILFASSGVAAGINNSESLLIWELEDLDERLRADNLDPSRLRLKHLEGWGCSTAQEMQRVVNRIPNTLESLKFRYFTGGTPEEERALFSHHRLQGLRTDIEMWRGYGEDSDLSAPGLRALWENMRGLKRLATPYDVWGGCPDDLGKPAFYDALEEMEVRCIGRNANNLDHHLARLPSIQGLRLTFLNSEPEGIDPFFRRIFGATEPSPLAKSVKELEIDLTHLTPMTVESLSVCSSLEKLHLFLDRYGCGRDASGLALRIRDLAKRFGPVDLKLTHFGGGQLVVLLDELADLGRVEEMVSDVVIEDHALYLSAKDGSLRKSLMRYCCLGDGLQVNGHTYKDD